MLNPVKLLCVLGVLLAGPLAAQPITRPAPDVPAALDVAGLHLVLTDEARRLVQQRADGLCRHQPSFQARVDLADAAFPVIDRVLQEEGVPLDFRYLALQESALQGDARSAHGAVGYWQLKAETALVLGLVVDSDVDERQHLVASTRAAARYLTRNHAVLRNWMSALLSYNTGLSGVKPYTLPSDAGATEMAITAATSPYVLMFLAQKLAFEPECGQNPAPPLRLQEFPAVAGQSLDAQAKVLDIDPLDLAEHNHWLLAPIVPVDRPYTLLVPISTAAQAARLLAAPRPGSVLVTPGAGLAHPAEVRVNGLRALLALPGDLPADLAFRGNRRVGDFLRDNEMTFLDKAVPGRPYYLESKREAGPVEYHVLQTGETVADVAQKYGMRQKAVLLKNRIDLVDELRPGRVLWLQHARPREVAIEYLALAEGGGSPPPTPPARPEAARISRPVVAAAPRSVPAPEPHDGWGDALPEPPRPGAPTAASLPPPAPAPAPPPLTDEPRRAAPAAAAENRPAARPAPAPNALPRPAPAAVLPAAVVETIHLAEPGESVYSISGRFHIPPPALMALNNLTPTSSLRIGQVVVLQQAVVAAPPAPLAGSTPAAASAPPASPAGRANPALYVPKPSAPALLPAAEEAPARHTVAKGETLYGIAHRYGLAVDNLQVWNGKATGAVRAGEVLRLQPGRK